jgi:putative transposase
MYAYRDGREARERLAAYFDTYNRRRLHQSLDYCTPDEVYFDARAEGLAAVA